MDQKISTRKVKAYHCIFLFMIFSSLSISQVYAQIGGLKEGDRVRVTAPAIQTGKIKGTVSSLSPDILAVSNSDTTIFIPNTAICELEISRGKKRNTGKGAIIGAVSGAVFLGVLSVATNEPCKENEWCFIELSTGEALGFGAFLGALGGGLNGAIIGTFIKTDRWKEVPLDVSVSLLPPGSTQSKNIPSISVRLTF